MSKRLVFGEAYPGSEVLSRRAFKYAALWDRCAILTVVTAIFKRLQDSSAHFSRIERLSPQSCLT